MFWHGTSPESSHRGDYREDRVVQTCFSGTSGTKGSHVHSPNLHIGEKKKGHSFSN